MDKRVYVEFIDEDKPTTYFCSDIKQENGFFVLNRITKDGRKQDFYISSGGIKVLSVLEVKASPEEKEKKIYDFQDVDDIEVVE